MTDAFLADDDTTWPAALTDLLAANLVELTAYEKHETDLNRRSANGDWKARYSPPPNLSRPTRERVLDEANAIIADASVVGYHCTRLVDHEIESILTSGMRPLSVELVHSKVSALVAAGHVTPELGALLQTQNAAHPGVGYGERVNMTWFIFSRSTLRDEGGLIRLLSQWGGEATYWLHEQTPDVIGHLRKLGTPCIVEAAMAVRDVKTFGTVGERLLCHYLTKRRVKCEHESTWEGHVKVSTPRVRRIIRRGDGLFEKLTRCNKWRTPL